MHCCKKATPGKKRPEKSIILPKRERIEETKTIIIAKNSNDNLAAMCNFDPTIVSTTPPDGYFMQKLYFRMERA